MTAREHIISIRVGEAEYQRLRAVASAAGLTLSDLARSLLAPPVALPGVETVAMPASVIWSAEGRGVQVSGGTLTVRAS